MNMLVKTAILVTVSALLAGCATTGTSGHWSNDWRNCMAAGVVTGAAVGATDDSDAARDGAIIGGVIGSLVCALRHKDEDGDGVRDDDDRCPDTYPGAAVDQYGCELDFDGDGVPDRLDKCPDTPAGARVDARGCELDSDGDGVADSRDQCPGTPAGAAVDELGCELDSDNDGVVDSRDRCPGTAEGTPVDNTGCELEQHYRLDGVYFEFDSARLTAESSAALDDAFNILERHTDLIVEVAGHTDSVGTDSYNQGLSERRARAVVDYLVAKGIDAGRLKARGYGESEPVADNATDAGRAENRRVELRHD